jgi:hypothetical protein
VKLQSRIFAKEYLNFFMSLFCTDLYHTLYNIV